MRTSSPAANERPPLPVATRPPLTFSRVGSPSHAELQAERVSAQAAYARALELDGGYAEAWNNMGTLDQMQQRFGKAVAAYRKAIALKPGVANFWKNLGSGYLSQGRETEALEAYRTFTAPEKVAGLPSTPRNPIEVDSRPDRPQPRLDIERGKGMTVTVGRIRPCTVLDLRLALLSHNTIRGAAGAAVQNAELAVVDGWVTE